MLLTVLLPMKWMVGVLLAITPVLVFAPVLYSYRLYKTHKAQGIEYTALPKTKGQKVAVWASCLVVAGILAAVAVLMFTGDISYTCTQEALEIKASYDRDIVVPYSDMEEIELREDFVIGMRVIGFASARLSSGTFQNEEYPSYTLYAYNRCPSMILIRSGEKILAINAATPEETQQLYEQLLQKKN